MSKDLEEERELATRVKRKSIPSRGKEKAGERQARSRKVRSMRSEGGELGDKTEKEGQAWACSGHMQIIR